MELIRILVRSPKEPLHKEVGWLDTSNDNLALKFYKDGVWQSLNKYFAEEELSKIIDEEDLSLINGKLRLADRLPDNSIADKGYTILRRNVQDGVNILSQDMISKENTIYEVRYSFDLQGSIIRIPEGSILLFNGGEFKNGSIENITNNIISDTPIFDNIKSNYPVSLSKFKNSLFTDSEIDSTLFIRSQEDFDNNIDNINNGNITKLIILDDIIINSEITVLNSLTITSYNNSVISFGKLINISQSFDKNDSHYIVHLNDFNTYDAFFDLDTRTRINFCGETKYYAIYGSEMEAWNILTNSKETDIEKVLSDEDVYARFKLSDEIISIIGQNISNEDLVNARLTYTAGFQNYYVPIYKIEDGYIYFKNPEVSSSAYFYIFGANNYKMSCVYSLINIESLMDEDSIFIDKNYNCYIPKKYYNCLNINYNRNCFNLSQDSTLYINNVSINSFPSLVECSGNNKVLLNKCNISNIVKTILISNNSILRCTNCKLSNAYEGFFKFNKSIESYIEHNEFVNTGLLKYNSYSISCGNSYNNLIRYNKFVNFLTGVGCGMSKYKPYSNVNAVIYGNIFTIDSDYISWNKALTDYGTICVATGNTGENKYKPDNENYATYIVNNIILNKCFGNKGRGIYLDDGAYNVKVEGNLTYGYSTGLTARTITELEYNTPAWMDDTVLEFINTNNKFIDNLIFEGSVIIGAREDRNSPPIIEGIFIFSKEDYDSPTLTNLTNSDKSNVRICRYYSVNDSSFSVTQPIYNYIKSYRKNHILSSYLSYINIDYSSSKPYTYSKNLRVDKLGGNSVTYPEKGLIHIQIPFYNTLLEYNLKIKTNYSLFPSEIRVRVQSYNDLTTTLVFINQGNINFQKIWYTSIKDDLNNLYADIWIESPTSYRCGTKATPDNWLKDLSIEGEVIQKSGIYNSSSSDTTSLYNANSGTFPSEANHILYEVVDSKPDYVDYGKYGAFDRDYNSSSFDTPLLLESYDKVRVLQRNSNSRLNPLLFTIYTSLNDLQESGAGSGYYFNGFTILYYDGSTSFNLDGTPYNNTI